MQAYWYHDQPHWYVDQRNEAARAMALVEVVSPLAEGTTYWRGSQRPSPDVSSRSLLESAWIG